MLEHHGHPCSEPIFYECHGCDETRIRPEHFNVDKGMCISCARQLCHLCRHLGEVYKCEYCEELTCMDCMVPNEDEIYECKECAG